MSLYTIGMYTIAYNVLETISKGFCHISIPVVSLQFEAPSS